MIGRGALARPSLPGEIARTLGILSPRPSLQNEPLGDREWAVLLQELVDLCGPGGRTLARLKQWLNLAQRHGEFRGFDAVKRAESVQGFFELLEGQGSARNATRAECAS